MNKLMFCTFGDFYVSGMQDAEVTKSLFRSSISIDHQSKSLNNVIIDCGKGSIDYCGKKVKFHTTIRDKTG